MSSKLRARALKTDRPDFNLELQKAGLVCGLDEVGRAPLAGPVVAACVYIPSDKRDHNVWEHVNDSKKITHKKRESLFEGIQNNSCWAIAECSVEEIENINILQASFLAMRRALEVMQKNFSVQMDGALVDGHIAPALPCAVQCIIKGDSKSVSIAAASIIAKVYRDRLMIELSKKHSHYGWESNAGYPTRTHLDGIQKHGITAHHRKTFAPVRNFIEFGSVTPQLKLAE